MNWQKWVLLGYIGLSTLILVGRTGKSRRYTTVDAVGGVIEFGVVAWLIVIS